VARGCGRGLNLLFRLAFAMLLLAAIAVAALGVRLAQGPLPLPWVAGLMEDAANTPDQATRVGIGGVVLAWDHAAPDQPIDLLLTGVTLTDVDGRQLAALPRAAVSLALPPLLLGRIAVRAVVLSGLDLRLMRAEDGAVALDLGTEGERLERAPADAGSDNAALRRVLAELTAADQGPFGRHQLRKVTIRDARLAIADAQLGTAWSLPDLDLALTRTPHGVEAGGGASLLLGSEQVRLGLAAQWQQDTGGTALAVRLGAIRPAALARVSPRLAALALVDAMLSADARLRLDAEFRLVDAALAVQLGPGRIVPPNTVGIPIRSGILTITGTDSTVNLTDARVTLDTRADAPPPVLSATSTLQLGEAPRLSLTARLPRFDLAELAHIWPEGVGRNERAWLVPNLSGGIASDVAMVLEGTLPADLSDLAPTRLELLGRVDAATVHYLRPMPPVEDARGQFRIDLEAVDVQVDGGRIGRGVQGRGTVRLSSLDVHPQLAEIAIDISSPLPEVLAVLQHPKLKLFEARPLPAPIAQATGTAAAKLTVRFPLLNELDVGDVRVGAEGRITDGKIPRLVAGQDITDARLALSVTNDGMRLSGPVRLAGVAASVTYEQDFRAGPPAQVIERLRAEGRADDRLLAALRLDTGGRLAGAVPTTVAMTTRRNGSAEAAIRADLREARISLPEAAFDKPAGQPGSVEGTLRLARERITGLENLRIDAPGLSLRGRVGFTQGAPDRLVLASLALGRTRGSGEIVFSRDGALAVTARGAVLDATPLFAPSADPPAPDTGPRMAPLRLDLGFDRVLLANDRTADGMSLRLERRAGRLEQVSLSGRIGGDQPVEATLARRADGRVLTLRAGDAGGFLAATDVITSMAGGRLVVEGKFDEATDGLAGTAEITDFRVRDAPAIGRLLQGMTLYGLLDLARGPGLNFSQLSAPFSWADGVLTLGDARAFSPSLGVTTKGRIDTRARRLDLEGTVVPAYFFNSLLGNIPLIGRLFSPERGGGVFAATFSARGPMADPQVTVNPLAALTPGFLRGLFGIFDAPSAPAAPAPAPGAPAAAGTRSPPHFEPNSRTPPG
jgi:uncharacterized protein YhdP